MEHPVGFEPTMRELQSRALDQTWLWVHKTGNFPRLFLLRITLIPLHNSFPKSTNYFFEVVLAVRIERTTSGFSDQCSYLTELHKHNWYFRVDLNHRLPLYQSGALTNWTTEVYKWWDFSDSNTGHFGYEPNALTNWAKVPILSFFDFSHSQEQVQL